MAAATELSVNKIPVKERKIPIPESTPLSDFEKEVLEACYTQHGDKIREFNITFGA